MPSAYIDRIKDFLITQVSQQVNGYDAVGLIPDYLLENCQTIGLFNQQLMTPDEFWHSHELTGYVCSSLRSLQTVNNMGLQALKRFGSQQLQQSIYSRCTENTGPLIAFALTEPQAGSDAKSIQLYAEPKEEYYFLTGDKAWVTGAQYADWILVFAKTGMQRDTAFLIPKNLKGLTVTPISAPFSTRAAGAASLKFEQCKVQQQYRLGKEGAGLDWIAATCLDTGRFSVAAGAMGIAKAALDICLQHLRVHPDQVNPLSQQPMIQKTVADLVTEIQATQALALRVIEKRTQQSSEATSITTVLKYKAAKVATDSTYTAMQLLGQRAFRGGTTLERLHRDAQCLPLIEGTENINAAVIAKAAFRGVFQ
ncbi:MAG: acyl-CoA dehydrogenase [Pseudomonadales bacterium]|nr:acyl-CoA dehydrogenase [Pseudomonadales bacterium]